MQSEISQTVKDKYMICFLQTSKKSKNTSTNEPFYKTEIESQKQKTSMVTKGWGGEGGINWEVENDILTLLYIKQITNKNLLYSTGNSTQYSVMTYIRTESKKGVDIGMYITDSLCCIAETSTTL